MNSGLTKSQIQTELSLALVGVGEVEAVFGFGSFFRGEPFNDVDLALVFTENCDNALAVFERVLLRLRAAEDRLGAHLHVTPFTAKEFRERPLREHALLVALFPRLSPVQGESQE
jgi:predicted nucleotidyltransferase